LESGKLDVFTRNSFRAGFDPTALDQGISKFLHDGFLQVSHLVGQLQRHGQTHACKNRRAPQ